MRTLSNSIAFFLAGTAALTAAASAEESRVMGPPSALILFGANWCAPCLAELRILPDLAAGVAPEQIVLAWTDAKPMTLWPSWPGNAALMPRADAARLAAEMGRESAGLPFAAQLDGNGRLCSVWRGKVTRERIAALKARCKMPA